MAWWDSALERRSIQSGMKVRGTEGGQLGRVRFIGSEVLYVRPWRFSRREYTVPLSRVSRVTGGAVYVQGRADEPLQPAGDQRHHDVLTQVRPLAEPASTGHA